MGYGLDPEFERVACLLSARSKQFWLRIGSRVDPGELAVPLHAVVMKVCRDVARDHGYPTPAEVVQRSCLWMGEGKATEAEVLAVGEFLEGDLSGADPERVIKELVEPVRRLWMQQLCKRVFERYKNVAPFGSVLDEMAACDNLGQPVAETDVKSSEIGEDTEQILLDAPMAYQMPTGIPDLDVQFRGGQPLGTVSTILGDSGAGKSMLLSFASAVAAMHGENVGYLSLELPKAEVHRRIMAAILGIPIFDLMDAKIAAEAVQAWKRMRASGRIGRILVERFDPGTLDIAGVQAWFRNQERLHDLRVRFRVVDYGDVVGSSKRNEQENTYKLAETVWQGFVAMAQEEGRQNWVLTACQSKRPDWKPGQPIPILTRGAVADSAHKYRLSDFFISMTPQPDIQASAGYAWYIDKDRYFGKAGTLVGPVPHQRYLGRMADISHLG